MTPPHNYARQGAPGCIFQRRKSWLAGVPNLPRMAQSAARAQPHEVSQGQKSSPTCSLEAPPVPPPLASFITGTQTLGFQSKPQNPVSLVLFFPFSQMRRLETRSTGKAGRGRRDEKGMEPCTQALRARPSLLPKPALQSEEGVQKGAILPSSGLRQADQGP